MKMSFYGFMFVAGLFVLANGLAIGNFDRAMLGAILSLIYACFAAEAWRDR